jgi:hypothetical protein
MRNWFFNPSEGRDTNDGLTELTPKQGLHAYRNQFAAGDTIILRGGNYLDGIYPYASGTDQLPITVKSYDGERARFVGPGSYGVSICPTDWWKIQDIDFEPTGTFAFVMRGSNSTIENCNLKLKGIRVDGGNYNKILNNTASNIGWRGTSNEGVGEFVFIFGGTGNEVGYNKIASIGHAGISVQNTANDSVKAVGNWVHHNEVDQRVANGLPGGGGGIYSGRGAVGTIVEDNVIHGVGNLPGLNANKAGIYFSGKGNISRRNHVESYGIPGSDSHRALMVAGTTQMNNPCGNDNLFEDDFVGAGYGTPIYLGERGGRALGGVIANNIFRRVTLTTPINALTSNSYIGMFTQSAKYPIYMGCYNDGAWPVFANGNKFLDTKFIKADGSDEDGKDQNVRIGYYFGSGGWSKPISQTLKDYPEIFTSTNVEIAAVATPPPVIVPPVVVPPVAIKPAVLTIPGESIIWTDEKDGKQYRYHSIGGVLIKETA